MPPTNHVNEEVKHAVLKALKDNSAAPKPQTRDTNALVVQGGGMRGIYSAGVLTRLAELGFSNSFRHIFASSSGAINAAYFAAGQESEIVPGYIDAAESGEFINIRNFPNILNADWLIDNIIKKKRKLNIDALQNSLTEVHVVISDFETGEAKIISSKNSAYDFYEVLRATIAIPLFYRRPVYLDGRRYIDGGVSSVAPVYEAIDLGMKNILAAVTLPASYRRMRVPWPINHVIDFVFGDFSEPVRQFIKGPDNVFNAIMDSLQDPPAALPGVNVTAILPEKNELIVGRLTQSIPKLKKQVEIAYRDTDRFVTNQ